MPKIAQFGSNKKIIHIGNIFRYLDMPTDWRIILWTSPRQENKKSVRLSNLPTLARGRIINPTTPIAPKRIDRVIHLKDSDKLIEVSLGEFPKDVSYLALQKHESMQYAFRLKQESKPTIYIPTIELARAIFLINTYFVRAALSSTTLHQEFDVQKNDDGHVDIYILSTSNFPYTAFEQSGTKMMLAWLLTNKHARRSFESIFQKFQANRKIENTLESWAFSFDPPPMANWKLNVRGEYSSDKTCFLVHEIVGLDIDSEMPSSVSFIHPDFIKTESNEGDKRVKNSNGLNWIERTDDFVIDDEKTASDANPTVILEDALSWVTFKQICKINKKSTQQSSDKIKSKKTKEIGIGRYVSLDEASAAGELPNASAGGKFDVTNKDQQFSGRFKSFNDMLLILEKKYHCVILDSLTHELSKIGRSKLHLLKNGSRRVIKAVHIRRDSANVMLLELDTSDGAKSISTQVLYGVDREIWIEQFHEIKKQVVENTLSWPTQLFDQYYGVTGYRSIVHPKNQGAELGNIPVDALEAWAERVVSIIN